MSVSKAKRAVKRQAVTELVNKYRLTHRGFSLKRLREKARRYLECKFNSAV